MSDMKEEKEYREEMKESKEEGCVEKEALATEPFEEIERLKGLLEEKTREARLNHEKYLRACADLENYRKRTAKETARTIEYANETLLKEILPVIDNLERALEHAEKEKGFESLKEGVRLTLDQMRAVLKKFGLREIKALGERFDPEKHHCISHEEKEGCEPGTVIKEFQKGYIFKNKLLRPSLVAVAKEGERREEG